MITLARFCKECYNTSTGKIAVCPKFSRHSAVYLVPVSGITAVSAIQPLPARRQCKTQLQPCGRSRGTGVNSDGKEENMVVYNRLFEELFRRHMYKVDLEKMTGISGAIMARLAKNENVTVATLNKICLALDCQLSDIAEVVPDPQDALAKDDSG